MKAEERYKIAMSAAGQWSRCFKCDRVVNETGLTCVKPGGTCRKWYDAYKGALIALETMERWKKARSGELEHNPR